MKILLSVSVALSLAACARAPEQIQPNDVASTPYQGLSCSQLMRLPLDSMQLGYPGKEVASRADAPQ